MYNVCSFSAWLAHWRGEQLLVHGCKLDHVMCCFWVWTGFPPFSLMPSDLCFPYGNEREMRQTLGYLPVWLVDAVMKCETDEYDTVCAGLMMNGL